MGYLAGIRARRLWTLRGVSAIRSSGSPQVADQPGQLVGREQAPDRVTARFGGVWGRRRGGVPDVSPLLWTHD